LSALVVGVAGTHSTGKSTFCGEIKQILETNGVKVAIVPSFGKEAVEKGIPLLTDHTFDSTMWFIEKTLNAQKILCTTAQVVLVDRPILDAFAYWNAAVDYRNASRDEREVNEVRAIVSSHQDNYTALVVTKLDISVALGENRDTNQLFRQFVDMHLHRLLESMAIKHNVLTQKEKERILSALCHELLNKLGYI
jgi:thymidylate kinase